MDVSECVTQITAARMLGRYHGDIRRRLERGTLEGAKTADGFWLVQRRGILRLMEERISQEERMEAANR